MAKLMNHGRFLSPVTTELQRILLSNYSILQCGHPDMSQKGVTLRIYREQGQKSAKNMYLREISPFVIPWVIQQEKVIPREKRQWKSDGRSFFEHHPGEPQETRRKEQQAATRRVKETRDRPTGETIWQGKKMRYIFQLNKIDVFKGFSVSWILLGASMEGLSFESS